MKTYNLSKDYELLYKLLCEGHEIACFVDYKTARDICIARRLDPYIITFEARGIGYGSIPRDHKIFTVKGLVVRECERMNLEFILP